MLFNFGISIQRFPEYEELSDGTLSRIEGSKEFKVYPTISSDARSMRSRKNYSLNIEAAHAGKRAELSHFGAVFVLYLRCSTKGEDVLEMGVEAGLAILTSGSIEM